MISSLESKFSVLNPWFDELNYTWEDLIDKGVKRSFKKNEIIFRQNEEANFIYIVVEGRIRLFLLSPNGEEKAIAIIGKNGIIGECSLEENGLFTTNAITNSKAELIAIDKETFSEHINTNKRYSQQLIDMMTKKYRLLCMHTLQLSYIKSLSRIAETFVHLSIKYGEKLENDSIKLTISFTHQEMADLLGVTRVTVAKNIRWLEEKDYIVKVGKYYTINNLNELAELVSKELLE